MTLNDLVFSIGGSPVARIRIPVGVFRLCACVTSREIFAAFANALGAARKQARASLRAKSAENVAAAFGLPV
jgi:hypothetical protein